MVDNHLLVSIPTMLSFISWTALLPLVFAYVIVKVVGFRARLKSIKYFY